MTAYSESYLNEVVETQGKFFDYVAYKYPKSDTLSFIKSYMKSSTRKSIDECQPYVNTKNYKELLEYFLETDNYTFVDGESLKGFVPDWIGEFYAYYQWYYNISSSVLVKKITPEFLIKAYPGLHDLDLKLAVEKVGKQ